MSALFSSEQRNRLDAYLSAQTTLTLATISPEGDAHACDLFYAHSGEWTLYFLSDPKTLHIRNLLRSPHVSLTIHGPSQGWQEIRGVQIEGIAEQVTAPAERAAGLTLYLKKYAFVGQWLTGIDRLGQALRGLGVVELFRVTPRWIRWIDNSIGFGHKEEWSLPD